MIQRTIVPLLLIALSAACNSDKKKETAPTEEKACLDPKTNELVELTTAESHPVTTGIHLTGSIEANPDNVIHSMSLVDGIIANTYFSLGDRVSKGQVLAEMQSTELSALQAELEALEAQIEVATIALKAQEGLFNDGISSNKELIESKNNLRILVSEKRKIAHNLSFYKASDTKDVFELTAPASGIIIAKNINPGAAVTTGDEPLFSIADLSTVWAMANIYATDIAHITKGMEAEIKTLSYPDEVFNGKIDGISQVLDKNARVLNARLVLDNKHMKLKPGMIADMLILNKSDDHRVAIPTDCLVFFNGKNHVLVYKDDCHIETREVEIHAENNGLTYIESGLEENEQVISKNQLLIFEALNN